MLVALLLLSFGCFVTVNVFLTIIIEITSMHENRYDITVISARFTYLMLHHGLV